MSSKNDPQLAQLRAQIDALDSELVDLLHRRSQLTAQVGQVKSRTGMPIYVPEREDELILSLIQK